MDNLDPDAIADATPACFVPIFVAVGEAQADVEASITATAGVMGSLH